MNLSHKIELQPTESQIQAFRKACGCSRFAYNWGLSRWKELKSQGVEKVYMRDLKKEFNSIKEEKFPWIYESPKDANQQAFSDLQKSLKKCFTEKNIGFPKFRSRHKKMSFYISNDKCRIENNRLKVPVIGLVKMKENLRWNPEEVKILSYTISESGNRWWVSVSCEGNFISKEGNRGNEIGIDLGLKDFLVTSDNEKVKPPKFYRKSEKKLARVQKLFSKKQKESKNREKAKRKVRKVHYQIRCRRQDFLHKLSRKLVQENQLICLEDLNVAGMVRNKHLSKSIYDVGWSEFVRQLQYKSLQTGTIISKVDRFYASSKTCFHCGNKNSDLILTDRSWECKVCGESLDRDLNASRNILKEGKRILEKIPTASGDSKPVELKTSVSDENREQVLTVKQESKININSQVNIF